MMPTAGQYIQEIRMARRGTSGEIAKERLEDMKARAERPMRVCHVPYRMMVTEIVCATSNGFLRPESECRDRIVKVGRLIAPDYPPFGPEQIDATLKEHADTFSSMVLRESKGSRIVDRRSSSSCGA